MIKMLRRHGNAGVSLSILLVAALAACAIKKADVDARADGWPERKQAPADVNDLVIDVHAHVLNAWDIPVGPFLKKNKPIAAPLAPVLASVLRQRAPLDRGGTGDERFGSCLRDLRDSTLPYSDCSEEEAVQLFEQLLEEAPELQEELLEARDRGGDEGSVNWALEGPRIIRFVSAFHRSRTHQARTMLSLYDQVDLFVPAMVDMDGWPGEDAKLQSLEERLAAMGTAMHELNAAYPGVIHAFVSFNPLHGVEASPHYVEGYHRIIERTLLEDGFLGVKLYPAFGYFPINNATTSTDPERRPEHAEQIDDELLWLYGFAERYRIPVMAHCSAKGAELGKRHAEVYGHPRNWGPVLQRFPDLRFSLGHFGKASELLKNEDAENSWPLIVASMMAEYPNLYGDLALDGVPGEKQFDRMLDVLQGLMDDYPQIRSRLMYGSDWFMLMLDRGSDEYYERYDAHFTERRFGEKMRRDFFGANAVRYLGLDEAGTRERLRRYYRSRELTEPRWLAGGTAAAQGAG